MCELVTYKFNLYIKYLFKHWISSAKIGREKTFTQEFLIVAFSLDIYSFTISGSKLLQLIEYDAKE